MINQRALAVIKQEYLFDILKAQDLRASSALYAYARYLNRLPIQYDKFPLYLKIFESNNRFAVDALIEGFVPEDFFDLVIVPNHYIFKKIFELLDVHRCNTLYEKTVRVLCGFVAKAYSKVESGYRIYQPTITDLNNIAKHLDESKDQDYPANRAILNILQQLGDLDRLHETDKQKLDVGRQCNRIRADFLDDQRKLVNAITSAVLKKGEQIDFGIEPEQLLP